MLSSNSIFKYLIRKILTFVIFSVSLVLVSAPVHADLLQKVKERGYIDVGVEARYAPFEFVDNGEIVGYDITLIRKIIDDLPGVDIKFHDFPWVGLLPALSQKKVDFVVAGSFPTEDRLKIFRYTIPVADGTVGILKRADDESIETPDDLIGKVVAAQKGARQNEVFRAFNADLKKRRGKGVSNVKLYVGYDEAYSDLLNHRVDAVAQSLVPLQYIQKQNPDRFKVLSDTVGEPLYFAWPGARKDKDSKSLYRFINERLKKLGADGTMKNLQEKWFGSYTETPDHVVSEGGAVSK